MTRRSVRGAWAVLLTAVVASAATACTDDGGSPAGTVSKAASAVASAASRGGDVVASASAAAQEKLQNFKNGVNAGKDVKAGAVTDQGGRATAAGRRGRRDPPPRPAGPVSRSVRPGRRPGPRASAPPTRAPPW